MNLYVLTVSCFVSACSPSSFLVVLRRDECVFGVVLDDDCMDYILDGFLNDSEMGVVVCVIWCYVCGGGGGGGLI